MKKSEAGFTLPGLLALIIIPAIIVVKIAVLWCIVSFAVSGVKAVSDDCGTKYGIESVVAGDWLCPTKSGE